MPIYNKSFCVAVLALCSFHARAEQCSPESVNKNKTNNFILLQQQINGAIPKTIETRIESPDGYIRTTINASYNRCGELLGGSMLEVKTATYPQSVLVITSAIKLSKADYGWRILVDGKGIGTDKRNQKSTLLFRHNVEGMYLLNKKGIISKAVNRGTITATTPGEKDRTSMGTILYTLNTTGALTRSENKSNLAIENYRTEYEYDTHHRLTKRYTPNVVDEYVYDDAGLQLTWTNTETYYTIEKTVNTCKEWDTNGECIQADIDITISSPDNDKGKAFEYKHKAAMTATYEYWN